jgi:hypothetical protein
MTDQNPLLAKVRIPGETFRLPSRGKYYTNGEISDDVVDGEVHVAPMTTIDELVLKSPDKLLSGKAIEEVFLRRIPQIQKPMDLLSKDVDYLLMCLRLVSYGEDLDIQIAHTCEDAQMHTYTLQPRELLRSTKEVDPTKKYSVTMPNGQVVEMRPPMFKDVIAMYQSTDNFDSMSNEDAAKIVFTNLSGMIKDVDGIENRDQILEWLNEVPAGWIGQIADEIIEVSDWGIQPKQTIKCKDCGEDWEIDVPSNPITFFT